VGEVDGRRVGGSVRSCEGRVVGPSVGVRVGVSDGA
jgi:hypothetical protein